MRDAAARDASRDDEETDAGRRADAGGDAGSAGSDGGPQDAGRDAATVDGGQLDGGAATDGGAASDGGHDAGSGDCPAGLAAWWRFEETTGPVVDSCGAHDGELEGTGVSRGIDGPSGSAILFAGIDGRVVVPDARTLDFVEAGTIELWLRVDGDDVGSTVSRGRADAYDNLLQNTDCYNVRTQFSEVADGPVTVTSACDSLPVSEWVHVAVVNDGRMLRLYLNGALARTAAGGSLGPIEADVHIGRREEAYYPLEGAVDELKWWTVARSQAEVCADAGGTWSGSECEL